MSIQPIEFYAEQEQVLTEIQNNFSNNFFARGALSRLVGEVPEGQLSAEEIDRISLFDLLFFEKYKFVPNIRKEREGNIDKRILYLAYLSMPNSERLAKTQNMLGEIDSSGTIIYPYPRINDTDAEMVFMQAQELISLKKSGVLPDLREDLLAIHNPYITANISRES